MLFAKFWRGQCGVFSRNILKEGILACEPVVLGVYYILENIIHYYYCQSEGGEESNQAGEDFPLPPH